LVEKADWIGAGLAELGESGIGGVRVEVLARRLGVTKGGFYRRFKDRPALLAAMVETWTEGRIAAIREQTALHGESAPERLRGIVRLFSERVNAEGMAIELAIRAWARNDDTAAAAVLRVDEQRLDHVARLYEEIGTPGADARSCAVLFYAFIFGQGLLFLDPSPAARSRLIDGSADLLGF
jgi:AcrR family transcriptional regulator